MVDVISRFKEPSSYSAIAAVLAMVGVIVPSDLWQSIVMIGCGLSGAFGFFMKEKEGKTITKS
tara:strand:- start:87 stop:275 length:189 start_codon:yes stop_codon:yes gene_type:complete